MDDCDGRITPESIRRRQKEEDRRLREEEERMRRERHDFERLRREAKTKL